MNHGIGGGGGVYTGSGGSGNATSISIKPREPDAMDRIGELIASSIDSIRNAEVRVRDTIDRIVGALPQESDDKNVTSIGAPTIVQRLCDLERATSSLHRQLDRIREAKI